MNSINCLAWCVEFAAKGFPDCKVTARNFLELMEHAARREIVNMDQSNAVLAARKWALAQVAA